MINCISSENNKALILKLDVAGKPIQWLTWQQATILYVRNRIAWTAGEHNMIIRGGINKAGKRSRIDLNSIIAIKGQVKSESTYKQAPLTNRALFQRDQHICLYCGNSFPAKKLTRDHVLPLSKNGSDDWMNVVSACQRCNTKKGARTPDEAGMPLLAIPFIPNHAEFLVLSNRQILGDQMAFLNTRRQKINRLSHIQSIPDV